MWFLVLAMASALATPVEAVLVDELDRAMAALAQRDEQPHYVALAVEDIDQVQVSVRDGALSQSATLRERFLDVDLRVGTPELDSTHALRGFSAMEGSDRSQVRFPLEDDAEVALRHTVWSEIDRTYRGAAERIVMIRANLNVKVDEESPAPDFEPVADPIVDRQPAPPLVLDRAAWEDMLVEVGRLLERDGVADQSNASLSGSRTEKVFVDTAGTRLQHGAVRLRVSLSVSATAPDGDVVTVNHSEDVHGVEALPSRAALEARARALVTRLEALVAAPRGQPYAGPVILAGKAAGVFFHEVLGHRVEGHRQKREYEGKTFAEYVGKPILPAFIDIYDDPAIPRLAGADLNGHYRYDDEGTPGTRAELVRGGDFVGFLMSRSPIAGFPNSNGHGRRMAGREPVARMGNLVIEARGGVPFAALEAQLRDEVRAQGLEYGILVEEIDGGFTLTGRQMPNAFNVRASASWRVYADGRPSELVRGIDLVGTPFVAFSNLIAVSDTPEVFNGYCGAESGWVPVSAVAPAVLFRRLEFQLKEKGQERPPLLTRPTMDVDGAAEVSP